MFSMSVRQYVEWGILVIFCLGMWWWTYVDVGHAVGIWFMLMPPIFFINEQVLGRWIFPYRTQVQTGITVGYMFVLWVLITLRH